MKLLLAILLAMVLSMAAQAAAPSPFELYAAGKYETAIAAGEALGTGAGYAIAARAALADATTRPGPCLECLHHAEDLAQKAMAADPSLPEPHVYLAAAMGYEARIQGWFWAGTHRYAGRSARELVAALKLDRKDAWAWAALGGWHIEVVHASSESGAEFIFHASVDLGMKYFARAFSYAPDNISIRYQYALTLSGYDPDRFGAQIRDAFARIAKLKPQTAYESLVQKRAAELDALLAKGDRAALDARVRQYQGYP